MKYLMIVLFIAVCFSLNAQEKSIKEQLSEIALQEGIDKGQLYKYRKANLKLTRKPIDGHSAHYNIPVISNHRSDVKFMDHNGERYYKTYQDLYRDACRFFYHNNKFRIPDHPLSNGPELKFVCTKGKCTLIDPVGQVQPSNADQATKAIIVKIQDQVDIIRNVVQLSKAKEAYNQGYDLYYSQTLQPYLTNIADLERELFEMRKSIP